MLVARRCGHPAFKSLKPQRCLSGRLTAQGGLLFFKYINLKHPLRLIKHLLPEK